MTPDTLRRCGELLYWRDWPSALAEETRYSRRQMHRFASGDCVVPEALEQEIVNLMHERARDLDRLVAKLSTPATASG